MKVTVFRYCLPFGQPQPDKLGPPMSVKTLLRLYLPRKPTTKSQRAQKKPVSMLSSCFFPFWVLGVISVSRVGPASETKTLAKFKTSRRRDH